MAKLSDTYRKLFENFSKIDREMQSAPRDGLQTELRSAARAVVRFEVENELPKLKQLVADHGAAVAAIEGAKQKLTRLERSIASQESFISSRFATTDTTADALDLLGWRESARVGSATVDALTAKAVDLEQELKAFVRDRKGISDCLAVEQQFGWDRPTRDSFSWLNREFVATQPEPQRAAA